MNKRKYTAWGLLSIALSFMLLVFSPLETYLTNPGEFWYGIGTLLRLCFPVFLLGLLLFSVLFVVLKKREQLHSVIYVILLWLFIGLYIQGNFVPRNYGVLDGRAIKWDDYPGYEKASIAIALFVIIMITFSLAKGSVKGLILSCGPIVCVVIMVTQVLTLTFLFVSKGSHSSTNENLLITDDHVFSFADGRNIVVLLFDAFDSIYMSEMIEDENIQEVFRDFTFYPDTVGAFPTTKAALAHILTGMRYDNRLPYDDFIQNAYSETTLYQELAEKNYSIGVYTERTTFLNHNIDSYINVEQGSAQITDWTEFAKKIYSMVAFNYMPHQLKSHFVVYTGDFEKLRDSENLYNIDVVSVNDVFLKNGVQLHEPYTNAFRFIHLLGIHPPFDFGAGPSRESENVYTVHDEVKGCIDFADNYLNALRDTGLYDDTAIIIMADHGLDTGEFNEPLSRQYRCNPLFMIKDFESHHAFRISEEPISYDQLQATLLSLINNDIVSGSIWDKTVDNSQRHYLYYAWDNAWEKEYMPIMREYYVYGNVKENDIRPTGKYYYPPDYQTDTFNYEIDTLLSFGTNGNALQYCTLGLSRGEETFSWTDDKEVMMHFELTDCESDLVLSFSYGVNQNQHVIVKANGVTVDDYYVDEAEERSILIPAEHIREGKLELMFYLPEAVSPKELGIGEDERRLGLAFYTMMISCAPSLTE